ncbi:site-specific DNA-methyltransferase [Candidatus Berkelbacteria bacterium]|nr:site-specific DNA-methyltransferase [Candidatus Berkelbacteria bacterium]
MTNNQKILKAKGRPLLQWVGKKPLEKVEYFPAQEKEVYGDKKAKEFNKLFWGDNLQVLSHLLKDYRGKVDLIYIDPPFDSKADYVKKVRIRGEQVSGIKQSLIEEKQYADIWENDEYLQFMYERLMILKELLSDTGSIYIHLDWHKASYLKILMDEIFGQDNFTNEIIWYYWNKFQMRDMGSYARNHDNIFVYAKDKSRVKFYPQTQQLDRPKKLKKIYWDADKGRIQNVKDDKGKVVYEEVHDEKVDDVWDIPYLGTTAKERSDYPTQKPEELIKRIINSSSEPGDLVLDCFIGSGSTAASAQKLGRKWLGCDINIGAIQTTTKRLTQIINEQKGDSGLVESFSGSLGFKVFAVNDYDIFKNEVEAKDIVMDIYGVEPIKRSYFDGVLDNKYVKVMPLNRVCNKLDISKLLETIQSRSDEFKPKSSSSADETIYEQGVLMICSGMETDIHDYLKRENKTGVEVEVRDLLTHKKSLIFKEKPEARISIEVSGKNLKVTLQEFYSPILMRKLEIENEKSVKDESKARVEDFKQIIDSVAIDVDYDGKLFNAEVMDVPGKKDLIAGVYDWEYKKHGKNTVAVKLVDVLGDEYFETFDVEVK